MRRIGVLWSSSEDPVAQLRLATFLQGLRQLGWIDGQNVRIDIRWVAGSRLNARQYAAGLVALKPDVIFASGGATMGSLLEATRTVPIVFTIVTDPVGRGLEVAFTDDVP